MRVKENMRENVNNLRISYVSYQMPESFVLQLYGTVIKVQTQVCYFLPFFGNAFIESTDENDKKKSNESVETVVYIVRKEANVCLIHRLKSRRR